MDAVGPETYTYNELVKLIAYKIGRKARIVRLRPATALFLSRLIGFLVRDTLVTGDEVRGLMSNLLVSGEAPTGHTRLDDWLEENSVTLSARGTRPSLPGTIVDMSPASTAYCGEVHRGRS